MNRTGDQFLAGAALSANEHTPRCRTDALNFGLQLLHLFALADELVITGRIAPQALVVTFNERLIASPHQGNHSQIGHRDDEIKV